MDPIALLLRAQRAGLVIKPIGDRLLVRGPKSSEPVVRLLAEHKAEVLAALSPGAMEARRWSERYAASTSEWSRGKRTWQQARRLAWGDLQNEWHFANGRRCAAWQCAGCGGPLDGREAMNLPDGNQVHFEPIDCLITFGNRWRAEADAALVALGLEMPVEEGSP